MTNIETFFIEDNKLLIFDGLFSEEEIKHNFALVSLANFSFLHSSRDDTTAYREWAAPFSADDFSTHPLHNIFLNTAEQHSQLKNRICYDVFCSASTFGDMSFIHSDSTEEDTISVLYYCNHQWNSEWGGETIFYDSNNEARIAISVKPGRIVVFNGSLRHRAGVPNRICPEVRLTLSTRY